jgi:mono/diheme cytochrome c family protein
MADKPELRRIPRIRLFTTYLLAVAAMAACSKSGSSGPTLTPAQDQGRVAFNIACKRCHEPEDLQTAQNGPKLYGLFSKPTLPSGATATDEQVRQVIVHGFGKMPPADPKKLSPDDIGPLIQYLHVH